MDEKLYGSGAMVTQESYKGFLMILKRYESTVSRPLICRLSKDMHEAAGHSLYLKILSEPGAPK